VVEADRVVELAFRPPLAAKILAGRHGPELVVVGSAASLLEGDTLAVEIVVGAGSHLTVRSSAAQLAHPCPGGGRTRLTIDAEVGDEAALVWVPQPVVVCAGADHVTVARVRLAESAVAVWSDEVVLGRSGERPDGSRLATQLRVERAGRPLLVDGLDTAARGAHGPAVLAGCRVVATVHLLGRRAEADLRPAALTRFEPAGPATSWRGLGTESVDVRADVDGLVSALERATGREGRPMADPPAPVHAG
jgi:urease accessory protein